MKCPKCGSEYEGVSCPQCNGPKIIISDDDYLRRKKEWEENGKILGVKVRKDIDIDKVKGKDKSKYENKQNIDKLKKSSLPEIISKVDINLKRIKEKAKNIIKAIIKLKIFTKVNKKVNKPFIKKYWLKTSIIIVTIIIAIIAITGFYGLYKRLNMEMYIIGDDGRICTGGFESELICNQSDAIFTLDGESFYEKKLPPEISNKTILYSYASEDGKTFVTEVYDNSSIYTLYEWNDDGVNKVMEGTNEKNVKYIADSGKVLFTDITYLYEGAVSNIALYNYDATHSSDSDKSTTKGLLTLIEQNIRSQYLYLKNDTLIYLNSLNKLYTMDFDKLADKTLIGENIKDIYGVSTATAHLYSNTNEVVKPSDKDEAFIYSKSGEFYYYDIGNETSSYLFESTFSDVEIVYEENVSELYCMNTSDIYFGTIKNDSGATLSSLDHMSSISDNCYFPDSSTLVYVTKDGELVSMHKGNKTVIRNGVSSNSLNLVRNSDGITYISDGIQYYRSSLSSKEIKLQELEAGNDTSQTLVYKGHVYFMAANGELCACNFKGKDFSTFGTVTSFWVE